METINLCEECVLFGRCTVSCSSADEYWQKQNDAYDYVETEGE